MIQVLILHNLLELLQNFRHLDLVARECDLLVKLLVVLLRSQGHVYIPLVLDCVVCAAQQVARNLGPTISKTAVHYAEDPLFFNRPRSEPQQWTKLIEPALTALLTTAVRES